MSTMLLRPITAAALLAAALASALSTPEARSGEEAPRVEPSRPRGVFCADETVSFLVDAAAAPAGARAVDADGKEAGRTAVAAADGGKRRIEVSGLPPGWYRLVLAGPDGKDRPGVSFAVIPERSDVLMTPRDDLRRAPGPIACDAASSWLVARPGTGSSPEVKDCLRLARLAGLRLLRERIAWGEVEPRPGEYRWGRYDEVATAAKERGIAVYQIFHATPSWARADGDAKRMPDDLRTVWRFAQAAGKRFEGRVVAWEPWNEPDIEGFSKDPADQVAALQKAAWLGFKAASPSLAVTMVSLAMPPGTFIESFLENETAPYFEIYNFHTYDPLEGYPRRAKAHLDVMDRFGLGDKNVWVTEAGIGLKAPSGDLSMADALRQAEFLPKAYVLSLAHGAPSLPWTHFFFILPWYRENDVQFGLLERDLRPGPGYVALAALADALGDAVGPEALRGLPPGVAGWLFWRGPGPSATAVIWADKETPVAVPPGIEVRDSSGRTIDPGAARSIAAGPRIMYWLGPKAAFEPLGWDHRERKIARTPRAFSLDAIVLRFAFPADRADKKREAWRAKDGAIAGKVQVYDLGGKPFAGAVRLSGEAGLRVEPAEARVEVGPDGMAAVDVKVTWEKDGAPVRKLRAAAVPDGAKEPGARSSAAVARIVE